MSRGISVVSIHNVKLFAVAMFAVLGISMIAPQSALAANVYTTAAGKTCKQRVFASGSQSVCVSYMISLMNTSGKVSKANRVSPGVHFGSRTKAAVKEFQRDTNAKGGADGIVGKNTWAKLCAYGKSNKSAWTKAGCGGQGTNTYRTKPAATANSADYRWGYFNCYPKSVTYPNKPVWGCERKWVLKTSTVKDGSGVWAIKSKHAQVQKRYDQFQYDKSAYSYSKSLQSQTLNEWAGSRCRTMGSVKVKTVHGQAISYCKAKTI